jgi:preprotein translocase SecE subunit
MAKSRAQRKAEAAKRRQREEELRAEGKLGVESDTEAQHDTQVPESADVLEAEIAMEQGAAEAEREAGREAPAPSRADVGRPDQAEDDGEPALSRRERRRQEREQAQRTKAQMERRAAKPAAPERQRGPVISFFQSVWRELQKVQWPDRDTLVQASAVTLLFVAVAAAYLGALDAIFSRLVDLLIT